MSMLHFITDLFCRIDDALQDVPRHSQARLYPSEVVTLALLFALKGVGTRPFYRWLKRDYLPLFPSLPERTRLFRLFKSHSYLTESFMAEPTVLGVVDTYGIELIHPRCQMLEIKRQRNGAWVDDSDAGALSLGLSHCQGKHRCFIHGISTEDQDKIRPFNLS